jgi:hypothetical protein
MGVRHGLPCRLPGIHTDVKSLGVILVLQNLFDLSH